MKILNLSNQITIASQVDQAHSFVKRLKGLMFTEKLDSGCALHIQPCQSIHSYFMNYAIDVLYLNEHHVVIGTDSSFQPGKIGKFYPDARSVVELPAGTIQQTNTHVGDQLSFEIHNKS